MCLNDFFTPRLPHQRPSASQFGEMVPASSIPKTVDNVERILARAFQLLQLEVVGPLAGQAVAKLAKPHMHVSCGMQCCCP